MATIHAFPPDRIRKREIPAQRTPVHTGYLAACRLVEAILEFETESAGDIGTINALVRDMVPDRKKEIEDGFSTHLHGGLRRVEDGLCAETTDAHAADQLRNSFRASMKKSFESGRVGFLPAALYFSDLESVLRNVRGVGGFEMPVPRRDASSALPKPRLAAPA